MSNAVETYMPLVIEKYLGDTAHLTTMQHGAYLLLLMHYWRRGAALPDDDARLAATAKLSLAEWKKNRAVLAEFFTIDGGVWKQKRAEMELERARRKSEAAAESARKRWGDAKPMRTHMPSHSERNAKADALHDAKPMRGGCSSIQDSPDANASGRVGASRRRSPELPLPSDWEPMPRHYAKAAGLGLTAEHVPRLASRMRTWAATHDHRRRNWDAQFDSFIETEAKNGGQHGRFDANGDTARDAELRRRRAENDAAMAASCSDGSFEAALRRDDDRESGYDFGRA